MMKTRNVKLKNKQFEKLEIIKLHYLKTKGNSISKVALLGYLVDQLYSKIIVKNT